MEWLLYYAAGSAIFVFIAFAVSEYSGKGNPNDGEVLVATFAWPIIIIAILGTLAGAWLAHLIKCGPPE